MLIQFVHFLIIKIKDIAIIATQFSFFFFKLKLSAKSVLHIKQSQITENLVRSERCIVSYMYRYISFQYTYIMCSI